MIRTQIYLASRQRGELAAIARNGGMKQSELIRRAVDQFIEKHGQDRRRAVLRAAAGIWKDRTDLPSQLRRATVGTEVERITAVLGRHRNPD